jgi:hypothetical protein
MRMCLPLIWEIWKRQEICNAEAVTLSPRLVWSGLVWRGGGHCCSDCGLVEEEQEQGDDEEISFHGRRVAGRCLLSGERPLQDRGSGEGLALGHLFRIRVLVGG